MGSYGLVPSRFSQVRDTTGGSVTAWAAPWAAWLRPRRDI